MLLAFWSRISVTDHNFPLPNLHSSLMHPRALSGTDQRKNKGFACTDDFWGQEHFIKMHRPNRGRHEWHTCPAMCLGTALPRALLAQGLLPPAPAPLLSHWQPGGVRAGEEGVLPTSFRWKWCSVFCQLCIELYQHRQVYKRRRNHLLFN